MTNLVDKTHDSIAFLAREAPNGPLLYFIEDFLCDMAFNHGLVWLVALMPGIEGCR